MHFRKGATYMPNCCGAQGKTAQSSSEEGNHVIISSTFSQLQYNLLAVQRMFESGFTVPYNGKETLNGIFGMYSTGLRNNMPKEDFVKTGKDDTSVLLAGGGDRLLQSLVGIENLTSIAFCGMSSVVASYDDQAVATYISFPNSTFDNGGYLLITYSTGVMNIRSPSNTYLQCVSATWVK
ncbi:MAG: hypothetical protein EZS28_012648 [Streblomastix strix]|uniref:Uncharacterized protein n=1 Tax=Streblomastix strix TaxID=222440 RepID=A0A5J4WBT2_9EUKA|nr:MAG: hypothetical protein EZS28_012648 [Streblomastix strix]